MKKLTLLALLLAAISQAAIAGEKEATDALYSDAKPLAMVGPFTDSNGCLWGVGETKGKVNLIQIVEDGKQVCRKAVVINNTLSGRSINGSPASGVLLTRQGDACSLTEYKRSSDKPNEVALPVVNHRIFKCDAQGNPV